MAFEKAVLEKVATVLESSNRASFFCGSLCVICNIAEAKKVLRKLNQDYNNKVQMSRDGSYGYIFDFIA
jgi:hypothetical protein